MSPDNQIQIIILKYNLKIDVDLAPIKLIHDHPKCGFLTIFPVLVI